jgi:hypothetical protein
MRIGKFAKTSFLISLLGTNTVGQDRDQAIQVLADAISEGTSNAESLETNGFRIQSSQARELDRNLEPSGNQFQMMFVGAADMFRVAIENGRPGMSLGGGIGVFHRESGKPMMSFGDVDGDGRIDVLEYYVLDENGDTTISVTDYELDGQPDLRVNFAEQYFEIWHADRWYRVAEQDERRGIVMNGEFIELRQENNRWIVP